MKQKFDLSLWLQDKSRKVMTRTGESVEIVLTDWGDPFTILGRIGNSGDPVIWLSDGRSDMDAKLHDNDLFFADEEEELTEFENALLAAFNCVTGKAVMTINQPISFQEDVNEWSKALLDIARKELKNNDWRQSLMSYKDAYEQGKRDALKDLPKWRECEFVSVYPSIADTLGNAKLYYKNHKIDIKELIEKLPKED